MSSSYKIQDRLELSLYINNTEYPIGDTNLLNSLHIATSVRASLPVLSLSITDVQHLLDTIGLQDGISIDITIKALGKESQVFSFRKFSHKRQQIGGNFTWYIYAYWDSVAYWNTTTCAGIQGTSHDVVNAIANKCNLGVDAVSTNDSMLWLPKNSAYRYFAKAVADKGYINDNSCMVLGVDLDGTLRYKDVNNLPKPTQTIAAYQMSKENISATDYHISTDAGFNNATTGYNNTRYVQSATSATTQEPISSLAFTPDSQSPQYNTTVKTEAGRGPVRYGPIDHGNVHPNYEKASYQNTRYKNLFAMCNEVLVNHPTSVQLIEQVTFVAQKEDGTPDAVNSGVYTVSGRSIYVQGSNYAEKFQMVRHGTNEKYVSG